MGKKKVRRKVGLLPAAVALLVLFPFLGGRFGLPGLNDTAVTRLPDSSTEAASEPETKTEAVFEEETAESEAETDPARGRMMGNADGAESVSEAEYSTEAEIQTEVLTEPEQETGMEESTEETVTEAVTESVSEAEDESDQEESAVTEMKIVVQETAVLVNGKEKSEEELRSLLEDADLQGRHYTLIDRYAIKAAYDRVVSILNEAGVTFAIEQ